MKIMKVICFRLFFLILSSTIICSNIAFATPAPGTVSQGIYLRSIQWTLSTENYYFIQGTTREGKFATIYVIRDALETYKSSALRCESMALASQLALPATSTGVYSYNSPTFYFSGNPYYFYDSYPGYLYAYFNGAKDTGIACSFGPK